MSEREGAERPISLDLYPYPPSLSLSLSLSLPLSPSLPLFPLQALVSVSSEKKASASIAIFLASTGATLQVLAAHSLLLKPVRWALIRVPSRL